MQTLLEVTDVIAQAGTVTGFAEIFGWALVLAAPVTALALGVAGGLRR